MLWQLAEMSSGIPRSARATRGARARMREWAIRLVEGMFIFVCLLLSGDGCGIYCCGIIVSVRRVFLFLMFVFLLQIDIGSRYELVMIMKVSEKKKRGKEEGCSRSIYVSMIPNAPT